MRQLKCYKCGFGQFIIEEYSYGKERRRCGMCGAHAGVWEDIPGSTQRVKTDE